LKLYTEFNNTEELSKLAGRLLEDRDALRLGQGETTIPLETLKNSSNEFTSLVDRIVDAISRRGEAKKES
jgi:hypothetical protein